MSGPDPQSPLRIVIDGGGVAGLEALLPIVLDPDDPTRSPART